VGNRTCGSFLYFFARPPTRGGDSKTIGIDQYRHQNFHERLYKYFSRRFIHHQSGTIIPACANLALGNRTCGSIFSLSDQLLKTTNSGDKQLEDTTDTHKHTYTSTSRTEHVNFLGASGRVSYPKEGQFLFSNLDNFAKWEIKILIFAAIIDTY
jgi:hypothetical protein